MRRQLVGLGQVLHLGLVLGRRLRRLVVHLPLGERGSTALLVVAVHCLHWILVTALGRTVVVIVAVLTLIFWKRVARLVLDFFLHWGVIVLLLLHHLLMLHHLLRLFVILLCRDLLIFALDHALLQVGLSTGRSR